MAERFNRMSLNLIAELDAEIREVSAKLRQLQLERADVEKALAAANSKEVLAAALNSVAPFVQSTEAVLLAVDDAHPDGLTVNEIVAAAATTYGKKAQRDSLAVLAHRHLRSGNTEQRENRYFISEQGHAVADAIRLKRHLPPKLVGQ